MGRANFDIDRLSPYRWVSVGVFLLMTVISFIPLLALGLLLPSITDELELSAGQQGILSSSGFWANLCLSIPIGWWVSRFSPRSLTIFMMAAAAASMFMHALAPGFLALLLARLIFGLITIVREPARALLTQQWFPSREIVLVSSMGNLLFGIVVGGGMLATPLVLDLVDNDWRQVFRIFGFGFVVMALLWIAIGREGPNREQSKSSALKDFGLIKSTVSYRDLWVASLAYFGFMVTYSAFFSFFPTFMEESYGVSLQASGALLTLSVFIGGVAGVAFGYIAMDFNKGKLAMRWLGIVSFVSYVGMTLTGSVSVLTVLLVLNGIGHGFYPVLYTVPYLLPGIRPREVAVASTIVNTMMSAGAVFGPLFAGFISEWTGSLRTGLIVCSLPVLSLTIAAIMLRVGSVSVKTD